MSHFVESLLILRVSVTGANRCFSIEMFELFATMAETFVFAYLGLSIFSLYAQYDYVFIIMTVVRLAHPERAPCIPQRDLPLFSDRFRLSRPCTI